MLVVDHPQPSAVVLDVMWWTFVQSSTPYITDICVVPYPNQLLILLSWPGVWQVCQWLREGLSVDPSKPPSTKDLFDNLNGLIEQLTGN